MESSTIPFLPVRASASASEKGLRSPLELDEATMREMVAGALDRIIGHITELPASHVQTAPRPRAVGAGPGAPLPEGGADFDGILKHVFEDVIPAGVNTAGPGYLGYIPGGGIFHAALADFIAKSVNRHVGYWYMAPAMVELEQTVVRWFCDIVEYGPEAGGVLTSGGSMATLTAVIAARSTRLPEDFRAGVIYVTSQTHYSVAKAALLAGFPARCLRQVAVDAEWRMDPAALEAAIASDRAAGLTPFMVVATAGTTNTGAVDPLDALADVTEREGLWLHVDGAYGGFFMLSEAGRQTLAGMGRADSITLDPHKGLCLPYGTGALVTRNVAALKDTYGARCEYLPPMNMVEGEVDFCGLSAELSRDWRGLRVWLPLMMHGVGPFRENVDEKLALAREAEAALRAMPDVEILASPQLSVLAFRLNPGDRSPEQLDALNEQWLEAITRRQRILLSPTRLNGRFAIRMALLSFRTHRDRVLDGLDDLREAAVEVLDTGASLSELFERQARATPEKDALIVGERRVSFGELDAAAERIADALRSRGLREGGHVGVYFSRSAEAVTAILGILKAGGVYVPIDPKDPRERQRFIVGDANLEVLVCAERSVAVVGLIDPARIVSVREVEAASHAPRLHSTTPERQGDRAIYLLYTSGSTGRPKGVVGLLSATLNRLGWMWREFPFLAGESYLHRTTLTFVDAVWEIFGPLLRGVPLVVLGAESTGDPDAMAAAVERHGVTRLTAVPSILDPMIKRARGSDALSSLRVVISSGERLQAPLLARLRDALPEATVLNLYGSTEVAGDVTCAAFAPGDAAPISDVAIGTAIDDARLFVVDDQQQPVPDGEEGELLVGGPVIAQGYHRRHDEHAARFVVCPHLTEGPIFRTGDRVRRDAAGVLHYLGRRDRQVKVRGVRIELDEVERVLLATLGPAAAGAVVARNRPALDADSDPGLCVVAFVAPSTVDVAAVREALAAKLPAAFVPAIVVALDALPLLPNGKTDRQALQKQTLPGPEEDGREATALEKRILALWSRRLPARPTSVSSDFHALGGDSLDLVEILGELGCTVPIASLPRPLTVAALTRALEQGAASEPEIDVRALSSEHYDETLALLVESFSLREPMAAALRAEPADIVPFALALMERCWSEPFSYIALAPSGRVVGFCFAHDVTGPALAFEPARRVVPLFDVLASLLGRYLADARPGADEVLEIAATGAARDVDGYAVARALEQRALHDAKARGFQRAVSLCTNAVTRHLALGEQGMRVVDEIDYATYQHEGRKVFMAAARHGGVALVEGTLA